MKNKKNLITSILFLLGFLFNTNIHAQNQQVNVTLQVDMNGVEVSPNGVFVAGSFQGWDPSSTQLTDDGNNIYSVTIEVDAVLYFQITDPIKATYEINDLPNAIEKLTKTIETSTEILENVTEDNETPT